MSTTNAIKPSFYEDRAAQHRAKHDRLAKHSLRISNARGLSFVVFAAGAGFAIFGSGGALAIALGALGLCAFIGLVIYHSKVIQQEEMEQRWLQVNLDAAARVKPDAWHDLLHRGESFRDQNHPYADDLDLLGRGSLFQRLCTAQTQMGQTRLFELLSGPCPTQELGQRQAAVRVLAAQLEFRQHLEILAMATRPAPHKADPMASPANLEPFLQWAQAARDRSVLTRWLLLAWALPGMTTITAILVFLGTLPSWSIAVLLALHLVSIVKTRAQIRVLIGALTKAEGMVERAGPLFELLESNTELDWLKRRFVNSTELPSVAMNQLSRIGGWFDLRHNGLIYPFVNLLALWDIHCWLAFERWQQHYGHKVREWFATFGDVEALSSLAGFAHDEPDCCYAEMVTENAGFDAVGLGHPLIHVEQRVVNDVAGLLPGYGLLVTGSNMSGKSTYLRAVGLAAVMGLAGGPVCAERLRLRPLQIVTSMRISDSIAGGVSHFYAELLKLKRVLAATQEAEPVLFLLDEILHGTNSRERQIGAQYILAELLRAGALGAVSTHDSGLCTLGGELGQRLTLVHFRESVAQNQMTFDYRLYPGPVTEGNALRLMQRVGIPVPLQD